MYIKQIKLKNFRNYLEEKIELSPDINIIYGDNAQGKTNILESISLCSIGKSFRTHKEKELIKFNEKTANTEIDFIKNDRENNIKIEITDKKNILLNNIKIKKVSDILGKINIVLFTPEDMDILKKGPAGRRRFLDMMICGIRPAYVYALNQYLKVLEQRNCYLKQLYNGQQKGELLDIWNERLAVLGNNIYNYRREFINKLKEKINNIHKKVTEEKEEIKIKYLSDCEDKEKFLEELEKSKEADIKSGYTSKGIQRDDLIVYINGKQASIYGSQGQIRATILSLKITELDIIEEEIGEAPVLLLDDFMSELDEKRKNKLLENIKERQVIITCTEKIELNNVKTKTFKIEQGSVQKEGEKCIYT